MSEYCLRILCSSFNNCNKKPCECDRLKCSSEICNCCINNDKCDEESSNKVKSNGEVYVRIR